MEIILKYFSELSNEQIKQFEALDGLYNEWNRKINIISRKDIDRLYEKHVLHSLAITAVFNFLPGTKIVDIGTGGGFPGIPLAIFFPQVNFHLVDSIGKKIKVVNAIANSLGLKNVTTEHKRVAEIKNQKFDFAVARSVAPLVELWKWSKHLLNNKQPATSNQQPATSIPPGLILLKGGDLTNEIIESRVHPRMIEIIDIFPEIFFKEKYLLFVSQ